MSEEKNVATVGDTVLVFFVGILIGALAFAVFDEVFCENFNEAAACYGRATGEFKEGGYRFAYRVVIDTAKTDSLNNWQRFSGVEKEEEKKE